jgi:hypothetical protein
MPIVGTLQENRRMRRKELTMDATDVKQKPSEPTTSYEQFGDVSDGEARTSNHPAAGWYSDPSENHGLRCWDGTAWTDRVATGTLTACPSCGGTVSDQAPSCPHCGHPIRPTKTGATKVLVFGIISLVPGYGLIFGPLAWRFGNREIREINAGLRMPRGRRKSRAGRLLGIIGTVISIAFVVGVAVTPDATSSQPSTRVEPQQFFAEHGIEFVYPTDWEEMDFADVPQPLWRFVVTPDRSSGNWIMFVYIPTSVAADWGATEPTFGSFLDVFAGGDPAAFAAGPDEIEIAGVAGLEVSVAGLVGSRTGQPLLAEAVVLYGDEASYVLIAQYEPEHQDTVLAAWQTMLAGLELPGNGQYVDVEYRSSPVDIGHPRFVYLDTTGSSFVGGAWYDEQERYMVILWQDTYYHHCGMTPQTWATLAEAPSFDSFYTTSILGRFNCSNGSVPEYGDSNGQSSGGSTDEPDSTPTTIVV